MCQPPPCVILIEDTIDAMRKHIIERLEASRDDKEAEVKKLNEELSGAGMFARRKLELKIMRVEVQLDTIRDQLVYLKRTKFRAPPPYVPAPKEEPVYT